MVRVHRLQQTTACDGRREGLGFTCAERQDASPTTRDIVSLALRTSYRLTHLPAMAASSPIQPTIQIHHEAQMTPGESYLNLRVARDTIGSSSGLVTGHAEARRGAQPSSGAVSFAICQMISARCGPSTSL